MAIIKRIWHEFTSFTRDDRGQDLVEYALLSMLIGVLGIAAWDAIAGGIGNAYGDWDTNNQNLWVPDDPVGP